MQLSCRVGDIAAAVQRVRAAGGHADEPEHKPYGLLAGCIDDQGATFRLWQPVGRPKQENAAANQLRVAMAARAFECAGSAFLSEWAPTTLAELQSR